MNDDDLSEIRCEKCGEQMVQIIYAAEKRRRGWYCLPPSNYFKKVTGRERLLSK